MAANTQVAVVDADRPAEPFPLERCNLMISVLVDPAGFFKLSVTDNCPGCKHPVMTHFWDVAQRSAPKAGTAPPGAAGSEASVTAVLVQQYAEQNEPGLKSTTLQEKAIAEVFQDRARHRGLTIDAIRKKARGNNFPVELVVWYNATFHMKEQDTFFLSTVMATHNELEKLIKANNLIVLKHSNPQTRQDDGATMLALKVPLFADPDLTDVNSKIVGQYGSASGGTARSGERVFGAASGGHEYWAPVLGLDGSPLGWTDAGQIGESFEQLHATIDSLTAEVRALKNKSGQQRTSSRPASTTTKPAPKNSRQPAPKPSSKPSYRARGGGEVDEAVTEGIRIHPDVWATLDQTQRAEFIRARNAAGF